MLDVSYSERPSGYSGVFLVLIPNPNILINYHYYSLINSNSLSQQQYIGPVRDGNYQVFVYEISNTGFIIPELLTVINSSVLQGKCSCAILNELSKNN